MEAQTLERKYARQVTGVDIVDNPRVLCAATEQYAEEKYGFQFDAAVVERYFPGRITIERALSRRRLMDLLMRERFDIVHLVMGVDPNSGDLIFGRVDEGTREPLPGGTLMPPQGFRSFVVESGTRLVVLATCKALLLAVEIAAVANMAASDQEISGREASGWADCFYSLLAEGTPLFKAFDISRNQQPATPIRAIRHKDVVFAVPPSA